MEKKGQCSETFWSLFSKKKNFFLRAVLIFVIVVYNFVSKVN